MDGSLSKLLIFRPRCGHSGGDIDLMIQILHAGRERSAQAQLEREKKELKNRFRVVKGRKRNRDRQAGTNRDPSEKGSLGTPC